MQFSTTAIFLYFSKMTQLRTRSKALVCLATAVCIRKAENAKKGTEKKKGEVVSWNKPRLEDDIYF